MNNKLKEFEELLLDNMLFKVQTQALGNKNPSGSSGGKPFKSSCRRTDLKKHGINPL
jgi:hypothetical protein